MVCANAPSSSCSCGAIGRAQSLQADRAAAIETGHRGG